MRVRLLTSSPAQAAAGHATAVSPTGVELACRLRQAVEGDDAYVVRLLARDEAGEWVEIGQADLLHSDQWLLVWSPAAAPLALADGTTFIDAAAALISNSYTPRVAAPSPLPI